MRRRRSDGMLAALLAAITYVPLLASKPGQVAADTKAYLYLDPGRLTASAASMWDPSVGLGTVTHQNIGYLFPMGPYFTAVHWLGVPTWVGQRVWMGSLMFAAGLGAAYCARRLGLEGWGRLVTAVAYTLSPYLIDYLGRTSAIVMPWAALGWMIGLTVLAARTGRWRYPALFAVAVAAVGGVNATSILLVGLGPVLWLVYAAWATREIAARRAVATAARIGGLSLLVSLWWAAGLWAEGRYGLNVLRVTETVPTVSRTSSAAEVLRGLGYWYFYGWDKVQPWTLASVPYTQSLWMLGLSYAVPLVAVALGLMARWRYRGFAVMLVGLGVAVAVGAYPYAHPSLLGALLKDASNGSTVGLAMRSLNRAVPLVVLGLALLMGSGVAAIRIRWRTAGVVAAAACAALVAADLPPLWSGNLIASNLARPSSIPAYWTQAMAYLNAEGSSSRVLGLPGEDFAAYSRGVTQDPIAPGLLDRPYVSRQVVPEGTPPAANLVQALDEPLQEGTLDMAALAPVARLMSVGQILLQSDLQYERYHLPLPQVLWSQMVSPHAGLGQPVTFGAPNPATPVRYPLNSEIRLGIPTGTPQPPALAVFNVPDPRPLVRAENATSPILVAGDGSGLVEAGAARLLSGQSTILYSASLASDPAGFARAMAEGAQLVLTDTNPLAQYRWGSLRDNVGQVDQPGVSPLTTDPSDYSLPVFPGAGDSTRTVAQVTGVASVRASDYGDSLTFTPENRPINAVDGNPSTAWTYGAHSPATGGRIQINLDRPVTADHITLVQAQLARPDRRITSVTLTFDGGHPLGVALTPASFRPPGQTVSFPGRTFSQLQVTVDGVPGGADKRSDGLAQVGFAEIGIPGVGPAQEALRLPTDLLSQAGPASLDHPLTILMSRERAIEPPRHDPEPQMSRVFSLPTARTFSVAGTAEINAGDSDYLINQLIGLTPPGSLPPPSRAGPGAASVVAANSSSRLDDDRQARANAAADGNPSTAWIAETGPQAGEWLSLTLNKPITFDHLDLQVVNDGRHSLPTRLTISTEAGSRTVTVPPVPVGSGRPQGATTTVPVSFAPIEGSRIKVTVDAVHQVRTLDYYATFTGATDILPVGIAELGLPGVDQAPAPAEIPASCQAGLLTVDGRPVDIEVTGTTASALAGQPLQIRACGNSVAGVSLGPGPHMVQTSPRLPSGWSIDSLDLASSAGGAASGRAPGPASAASSAVSSASPSAAPAPSVQVEHQGRTSMDVRVTGGGGPFWLVLGQSYSSGWSATVAGGKSLGLPQLVDGYANGWYVPTGAITGTVTVHLSWSPQRVVTAAIVVSAAALILCVLIAVWPERWTVGLSRGRRRRARPRRRSKPRRRTGDGEGEIPAAWTPRPALRDPDLAAPAVGLGRRRLWVGAVGWAVLCGVVSRPAIGLIAGVAVVVACRWRHGRWALRGLTVAALIAVPVYVIVQQGRYRYWPTIDWPSQVSSANDVAWLALSFLGADLVAGLLRTRAAPGDTLAGGKMGRE